MESIDNRYINDLVDTSVAYVQDAIELFKYSKLKDRAFYNSRYLDNKTFDKCVNIKVVPLSSFIIISKWVYPFITKGTDMSIFNSDKISSACVATVQFECGEFKFAQAIRDGHRMLNVEYNATAIPPIYTMSLRDISLLYMVLDYDELRFITIPNDNNQPGPISVFKFSGSPKEDDRILSVAPNHIPGLSKFMNDVIAVSTSYIIDAMTRESTPLTKLSRVISLHSIVDKMVSVIEESRLADDGDIFELLDNNFEVTPGFWVNGQHTEFKSPTIVKK